MVQFCRATSWQALSVMVLSVGFWSSAGVAFSQSDAAPASSGMAHVSCRGAANEIRLTINNVKESVGLIAADLYRNEPDNFLNVDGREKQVRFAARAPITQFCLTAPADGDYAIAIYHDENANGRFDKGVFGLPAEPWGLSQNPRVRLGPPPISKSLFSVADDGADVDIRLRNR